MASWNDTFNNSPSGAADPGEGDDRIRETRLEIDLRATQEHDWHDTASTGTAIHKAGSARIYYQAAAPTLRPDGVTVLGASDTGRLWIDSDDENLHYWDGTQWLDVDVSVADTADIGTATVTDTVVDQGGGDTLYFKTINIGDWNMYTTVYKSIAMGVSAINIRSISVLIRNDDGTVLTPIKSSQASIAHTHGAGTYIDVYGSITGTSGSASLPSCNGYFMTSATNLYMYTLSGSAFISTDYDSTSYNRGYVTIIYVVP
jgi:hypothetical protein